jgi:hypothetical protein
VLDFVFDHDIHIENIMDFESSYPEKARELRKEAKGYWMLAHKKAPKYVLKELTNPEFLAGVKVSETIVEAEYRKVEKGGQPIGKWVNRAGELVTVEELAEEWYAHGGYECLSCERSLISSLVGTFLASVIQDPSDPRVVRCYRHSTRGWSQSNRNTPIIAFDLPEDFGNAAYYERRQEAFASRMEALKTRESLPSFFEDLLAESEGLRDYLWVNDESTLHVARAAIRVIPQNVVVACIDWAIRDFWLRQPGWPDLFVFRGDEFRFVEVKSPNDELSQEQMRWFEWALEAAKLPCEICRVKKLK